MCEMPKRRELSEAERSQILFLSAEGLSLVAIANITSLTWVQKYKN